MEKLVPSQPKEIPMKRRRITTIEWFKDPLGFEPKPVTPKFVSTKIHTLGYQCPATEPSTLQEFRITSGATPTEGLVYFKVKRYEGTSQRQEFNYTVWDATCNSIRTTLLLSLPEVLTGFSRWHAHRQWNQEAMVYWAGLEFSFDTRPKAFCERALEVAQEILEILEVPNVSKEILRFSPPRQHTFLLVGGTWVEEGEYYRQKLVTRLPAKPKLASVA